MKLFAKYNRFNIIATIFTFMVGSIAFYFVMHYILVRQLDESLHGEQQEIHEYVEIHQQLPEIQNTRHQWVTIEKTTELIHRRRIISYNFFNEHEHEFQSVRQLQFNLNVNNTLYLVKVNKSELETEDILKLMVLVTIGMIALILFLNLLINRKIISRLWQPFYHTVNAVKDYQLNDRKPFLLPAEPIDEFNLLNETLNHLMQNISRDYQVLKAFNENASHEMQTPLAVIRSKTELLLQQTEWNEEAVKQVLGIEDGIRKLTRLHQSLLLLTKIEHTKFEFNEPVIISTLIQQKLEEKQELFESRHITLETNIQPLTIPFHPHLAEILINNLLSNAIKYTPVHGYMHIAADQDKIVFRNTAANGPLDAGKIFQRFYKAEQNQEGIGLGLSIVHEICRIGGFRIEYSFEKDQHIFTIYFKNNP